MCAGVFLDCFVHLMATHCEILTYCISVFGNAEALSHV